MPGTALRKKVLGSLVYGGLSATRYERYECTSCIGGVDEADNYCRWCGAALETEPLALVPVPTSSGPHPGTEG
jgi:hypothetical protein